MISASIPSVVFCGESLPEMGAFTAQLAQKCVVTLIVNADDFMHIQDHQRFDLILLGFLHPSLDILHIVESITRRSPGTDIILLGGYLEQISLIRAFKIGITDYFPQPIDWHLLLERTEVILQEVRHKRQAHG